MFDVELRVRALRRHGLIEFSKRIQLPFAPVNWLTLYEGPINGNAGMQVQEIAWSIEGKRFVCQLLDDIDSRISYEDNEDALIAAYAARGWTVRSQAMRPCLYVEPA